MKLTKKQWFGLITLIVLLIASWLVTREPWKKSRPDIKPLDSVQAGHSTKL